MDQQAIIKRLEVIKNLILLEDFDLLEKPVRQLEQENAGADLGGILDALKQRSYGEAQRLIAAYRTKAAAVIYYQDPEVETLRIEVRLLEQELLELEDQHAAMLKLAHEFARRYQIEVGELLEKILRLRRERAARRKAENPTPEAAAQAEEAEKDYDTFKEDQELAVKRKVAELSEAEEKELKKLYREGSKLCHPDVVPADQKAVAEKAFAELTDAYERNDLAGVRAMLERMKSRGLEGSAVDTMTDKESLRRRVQDLRKRSEALKREVETISRNEAYRTATSQTDWGTYFQNVKSQLAAEYEQMVRLHE